MKYDGLNDRQLSPNMIVNGAHTRVGLKLLIFISPGTLVCGQMPAKLMAFPSASCVLCVAICLVDGCKVLSSKC